MASVPTPTITSWQEHWNGRKAWAQSNGISYNDYSQVVKYDYQRMTNPEGYGAPMTDTEAFDAMMTLKSGNDPFSGPATAAPTVLSNPMKAIYSNAQNIFTGLFHAPDAIWQDVDSAVHGHFGKIANLIPGYTDFTSLFSSQGRQYLLENPLSDILDLGGIGKIADLAESGLRGAGMEAAADTLKQIPDHPISMGVKNLAGQLTSHFSTAANISQGITDVLSRQGWTQDTMRYIIRPSRAIKKMVENTPWPEWGEMGTNLVLKFGHIPGGRSVLNSINDFYKSITPKSAEDINSVMTLNDLDGTKTTPHDYINNPQIPENNKVAMRALIHATTNLELAKSMTEDEGGLGIIKPVYHPRTGEPGFVPDKKDEQGNWTGANGWDRYLRVYNRAVIKVNKAADVITAQNEVIYNSVNELKINSVQLPDEIAAASPGGLPQMNLPTALKYAVDYYSANRSRLFPPSIPAARLLSSLDLIHKDFYNLASRIDSFSEMANFRPLENLIKKTRKDLERSVIPDGEIKNFLNEQLDNITRESSKLYNQWANVEKNITAHNAAMTGYNRIAKRMQYTWNRYTQGRFEALVKQKMKKTIDEYIATHYQRGEIHVVNGIEVSGEMVEKALQDIYNGNYFSDEVKALIPMGQWNAITRSGYEFIDALKTQGYDPVFTTAINPRHVTSIEQGVVRSDLSRYASIAAEHATQGILTNHIYNVWLAIPKEASDIYYQQAVRTFIDDFMMQRTLTYAQIIEQSKTYFLSRTGVDQGDDVARANAWIIQNRYTEWDPSNMLGMESSIRTTGTRNNSTVFIKRSDLGLIQNTFKDLDYNMKKAWSTAMNAYRLGVLYASPRYAAHITFGGGFMTALRMEHPLVDTVRYFREAWNFSHDPNQMPLLMSRGVAEQDLRGNLVSDPFSVHNFYVGRKIADMTVQESMLKTGLSRVEAGLSIYKNALEHVSNAQRALSFLAAKARATAADMTSDVLAEARLWNLKPEEVIGARAANKALADMDVISPFERAVFMRYAFPFYGWARHILRYVLTFPSDYPLRAGIINALSMQAIGEGANLPDYLDRLLFLGAPNQEGNVSVLDYRQWNPFRDVANYMTWGGIVSSLNPVIASAFSSAFGVDPVTGGPDLYPELTYDSFYGSSSSPAGENYFSALLQQFSPQISTLTQVMSKTSTMREEAYDNPAKLPYLIADSLGVPWVPYTLNVKQEQIKASNDQYAVASAAVHQALVQDSTAPIAGYSGLLPYSGYEVNPGFIQAMIADANKQNTAAGTSIPAVDLIALPYSSPYTPEYQLAGPTSLPDTSSEQPGGLKQ